MARHVSAHAPLAVAASKRLVVESSGWADAALMTTQNDLAAAILASADAEEGARAFTEKRTPMWRGR